jgi:hypothetical protein
VIGEKPRLDAATRREFDFLGKVAQRVGAELARFRFERVRGEHEAGSIAPTHRVLDPGDRLLPILAEIAEDADEAGAQLASRLREDAPIDDRIGLRHYIQTPKAVPLFESSLVRRR